MNRYNCDEVLKAGLLPGNGEYWHDFIILEVRPIEAGFVIVYEQLLLDNTAGYLGKIKFSNAAVLKEGKELHRDQMLTLVGDWILDSTFVGDQYALIVNLELSDFGELTVRCAECAIQLVAQWDQYGNIAQRASLPVPKTVFDYRDMSYASKLLNYCPMHVFERVFVDQGTSQEIVYLLSATCSEGRSVMLELKGFNVRKYTFSRFIDTFVDLQWDINSTRLTLKLIDKYGREDVLEASSIQLREIVEY